MFFRLTIKVVLSDRYLGKGNVQSQQSAMKLAELGPRITMEIFKVENGVGEGDIIYHKYEQKTEEEAARLKARVRIQRGCLD
jgi:ribosome biogenesis protein SSF1/2